MDKLAAKGPAGKGIAASIAAALLAVYAVEGGYVDNPLDRGGKTRYGVTERVARAYGYTGDMRSFPQHCDELRPVCADIIYTIDYIDRPGFRPMAGISPPVFYEMVDSAVLHGQSRSSGWFVGALNGVCRTKFPPAVKVTAEHVNAYAICAWNLGAENVCVRMLDAMDGGQLAFFDRIVANNPSQRVFYRGWTRWRLNNVPRKLCKDLP